MFKLAIEVCFENHFGLIHAIFLSLGSTKSGYFFLGHPVLLSGVEISLRKPANCTNSKPNNLQKLLLRLLLKLKS